MSIKKIKILMIEDDVDQIFMYQSKFELEGFDFLTCRFGCDGLRAAVGKKPDLILLDLVLIKEDGLDILKKLKTNSLTKKIPVIIMTNLAKKDLAENCKDQGAVDFIVKAEATPSEVVGRVRKVLAKE